VVDTPHLTTLYSEFVRLDEQMRAVLRLLEEWANKIKKEKTEAENDLSHRLKAFDACLLYDKEKIIHEVINNISPETIIEIKEVHKKLLTTLQDKEDKIKIGTETILQKINEVDDYFDRLVFNEEEIIFKITQKVRTSCRTCFFGDEDTDKNKQKTGKWACWRTNKTSGDKHTPPDMKNEKFYSCIYWKPRFITKKVI
jgi:hypothetical protein